MLYSNTQASQRALLKVLRAEPQADLVGEIPVDGEPGCLQVFCARLRKPTCLWLCHASRYVPGPSQTQELLAAQAQEKIKKL